MNPKAVTLVLLAAAVGSSVLAFHLLGSGESPDAGAAAVLPASGTNGEIASSSQEGARSRVESNPLAVRPGDDAAPAEAESSPSQAQATLPQPGAAASATRPGPSGSGEPSADPQDLEKVFEREAVDPAWGPSMEATLYQEIGEVAGADLITVRTECRATLCRVQVSQRVPVQAGRSADESPAMYGMYEQIFARLGFESRSITSTADTNGIVTSVVYLPRGDAEPQN